MLELIKILNKHSRTFLNISIVFICLIITVHLFMNTEESFDSTGYIENELQERFSTVSDVFSNVADTVFPIRSSFQQVASIDNIDTQPIMPQLEQEESPENNINFVQIMQNEKIQDLILKALLAVLLSYLLIGYICRPN